MRVFVGPSDRPGKKLVAAFSDGKRVHFGCAGCGDYVRWSRVSRALADRKRAAYLARHGAPQSRENWRDLRSPGALSRWILWEKRSLREAVRAYARKLARQKAPYH